MESEEAEVLEITSEPEENNRCRNCEEQEAISGYSNQLCGDCREAFIKYPIPRWLRGFAAGILIIMLAALFRMPAFLEGAIHFSRAETAMKKRAYVTASKELHEVLNAFPDFLPANANLLIASAYNWDIEQLQQRYAWLENKNIEDKDLYSEIQEAISYVQQSIPEDTTLSKRIKNVHANELALQDLFTELDTTGHPDFAIGGTYIANAFYDQKDYKNCEQILQKVLGRYPNHFPSLSLMAAVKRNQGDFTSALAACDLLLQNNCEDIGTIAQKARIELKRKNDLAARKYANEAMQLDNENLLAMEAQAMVDYYEGKSTESNKLLAAIRSREKFTADSTISTRLSEIFSGKNSYR